MNDPADFARLGDLVGEACGLPPGVPRGGSRDRGTRQDRGAVRDPARLLAIIWPELVGEEIAANAQPVQLKKGRLVVSTSSSAWAQTLHLMGDAIASRINERLGHATVEKVVFRHAGWEERPAGSTSTGQRGSSEQQALPPSGADAPDKPGGAEPLSKEQEAVLAEVKTLGLSRELEETMLRAMRASFVRAQQGFVR